jgi:arsenical-resistance protein 2
VIWYCGRLQAVPIRPHISQSPLVALSVSQTECWLGSSSGRGSRAAVWFADYIKDQNDSTVESYVLEEGIMGWATAGEEYMKMMDEYDASVWKVKSK